ncbi:MAG: hypothetical protein K6F27_08030 [Ruminococcus sp.]|nr:hypothetical protein [Ruminococcus sp.]
MTNLSFDTGTYKEYSLNGGETIRVNVSDPGIIDRLKGCQAKIEDIQKRYGEIITEDNLGKLDAEIRALIDSVINCPGACDKAFGATNCFAIAGGQPIFVNFLEVLLAQLKKDIVAEQTAEKSAFEALNNEKTQKYITQTQSKPQIEQTSGSVKGFNLAALSQEEREKLLAELIGEPK